MDPLDLDLPIPSDTPAVAAAKRDLAMQQLEDRLNLIAKALQTPVVIPNVPPTAAIAVTGQSNLSASFSGAGSKDGDGTITAYAWAYGDGATGTGPIVSHTYAAAGTYAVKLTVTDDDGASTSAIKQVVVTAPPVVTPPTPPTGPVEPTGANIVSITALTGSTISAKLASAAATGKLVSLPAQAFTFDDFAEGVNSANPTHSGSGILATKPAGIVGSGIDKSILTMRPGTTSKSTVMVNGGHTALEYANFGGSMKVFRDFTLRGISIGDLAKTATGAASQNGNGSDATKDSPFIYNGFLIQKIDGLEFTRIKVQAIPGSDHVNPGESFFFDLYQCSNTTMTDVEIDGAGIGGTGIGPNFHTGTLNIIRANVHGLKYSCAIAAYQCSGTINLTDFWSDSNYHAINLEQNYAGLVVNIIRPRISNTTSGQDLFLGANGANGAFGSAKITISDPLDGNGKPATRYTARVPASYGGSTNLQKRSDVKVLVGGVDRTSSVLAFLN